MTSELVTRDETGPVAGFQRPQFPVGPGMNVGAVAIESERAVAEAQGQLILAKRFPRDLNTAYAELMESCKLAAFANVAFYNVPRKGAQGGAVSGPSIRLAEEVARVYGNFEFGHRELSRTDGKSEVEVYAWDKEKNNRSIRQITVMHVLDTRDGPRKLRDQKDVDDKIANVASKQVRGRILALMPKWLVESAVEECKKTLAGTNHEPISVRVRRMTQAFATFGVTTEHLEAYLGHKLDDVMLDELVELTGVFNAIREGAKPSDYFGGERQEPAAVTATPAAVAATDKPHPAAAATKRAAKSAAPPAEQERAPANDNEPKQAAPVEEPKPEPKPEPVAAAAGDDDVMF